MCSTWVSRFPLQATISAARGVILFTPEKNSHPVSAVYPSWRLSIGVVEGDFLPGVLQGAKGLQCPGVCTLNREKFIRRALGRSRLLRALPAQSRACNGWASRSAWRGGRLQYPIDLHFISEIQTARRWTAAIVCSFCVRRCHASLRRAALLLNCSHISVSTSDGLYEGLI